MDTTRRIADFIAGSSYEGLPPEVVTAAKRCLLDWLGVGLAGSTEPASCILLQTVREMGGKRQASIFGSALRTSALNAALANSAMSHVLDYDDTYAHVHSSSTLFPAIFAIAEKGQLGGKDVLSAFIPGFELEARLAEVVGDPFLARGLHPTASLGAFGAAASTGKLLGLNADQIVNALGIALTKVSGAVAALGTMAKCLQIGSSATNGLLAARLAQQGFTGPAAALEGEKGFFRVYLSAPQPQNFAADLGQSYRVTRDCFKLHACCRATHAAVDAALALRREHEIKPAD
ncbi:MAG: MmgE/PrpD family protein, partial [Chloroflexota bacterium]